MKRKAKKRKKHTKMFQLITLKLMKIWGERRMKKRGNRRGSIKLFFSFFFFISYVCIEDWVKRQVLLNHNCHQHIYFIFSSSSSSLVSSSNKSVYRLNLPGIFHIEYPTLYAGKQKTPPSSFNECHPILWS